ncbi:MAG TPA: PLDc N-terminal domain-containing protein [Methylophilaceae bacterium]|nr:PLDc N-terminal domain-containing protein [Methylophilaceae bacterium]
MGLEVGGLFGLIILSFDVWAILKVFQSSAGNGAKVFWTVLILVLPIIGFLVWLVAGPR